MKLFPFVAFALVMSSCAKFDVLPDLERNKYLDDISNLVTIDSITSKAIDISYCNIKVYYRFNKSNFEAMWDSVDVVGFKFNYPGTGKEIRYVELDETRAYAYPNYAYTNKDYSVSYWIMLKNGRSSDTLTTPTFHTAKFE